MNTTRRRFEFQPAHKIAIGYFGAAFFGALLLLLPISHKVPVGFTDAFFTSASALYVTGLSSVNTAATWTPFGDVIISLLIQLGGAGITALTVTLYLVSGRKIPYLTRMFLSEDRNYRIPGVVRLVKYVLYFSLTFEAVGAAVIMLYLKFVMHYTWLRASLFGAFHAVSAFNNAGFDLFGNSLEGFTTHPVILIIIGLLIIIGGLGFVVLAEFYERQRMSLHTKIVLLMTGFLIVVGTVLILGLEWNTSFRGLSWPYKILNAWFASVTTRTAGFDSIPIGNMRQITWFVMMLLMYIGASPGSTGGGIKTTTFFMLVKSAWSTLRNDPEITMYGRALPWQSAQRANLIFLLTITVIVSCALCDAILEPHIDFMRIMFEEVSAFGTVGLTTGITGIIHSPMKWILIFTMYIGRVGVLTFLVSLLQTSKSKVRHVEDRIFIG